MTTTLGAARRSKVGTIGPFEEQAGSIGDWALTGRGGGRRGRKGADVPGSHREAVPLAIGRRSRGTPSGIHWSPPSVQMPAEATGILGASS